MMVPSLQHSVNGTTCRNHHTQSCHHKVLANHNNSTQQSQKWESIVVDSELGKELWKWLELLSEEAVSKMLPHHILV